MMELAVKYDLLGADSWKLTDSELIARLTTQTVGDAQLIGEVGRRLTLGDLYSPLILWRTPSTSAYPTLASAESEAHY